jgi:hypothetical protein
MCSSNSLACNKVIVKIGTGLVKYSQNYVQVQPMDPKKVPLLTGGRCSDIINVVDVQ